MKRQSRADVAEDLRWLFQDSKAALGLRGLPIEPQIGGKQDNPGPGAEQLKAVRRERIIRAAVEALDERSRGILSTCYADRRIEPTMAATWGEAVARVILWLHATTDADRRACVTIVQGAHDAYQRVREQHDREHLDAVRSAREAGQARRAAMLASTRETAMKRGEKEAIELAAWLESVGLVEGGEVDWERLEGVAG